MKWLVKLINVTSNASITIHLTFFNKPENGLRKTLIRRIFTDYFSCVNPPDQRKKISTTQGG